MVFVNVIADIVHSQVDKYQGSANKNIGDAFLLVWKFDDNEIMKGTTFTNANTLRINKSVKTVSIKADLALFSFLKIISKTNKFKHILEYRKNKKLNERIEGYKVRMGFGLHFGWAIEGAIGS